ncbi:TraB/GumN family protein [Alteromonas sp. BL110]|uniref:TraB/GumN family protein n=1 Tax=Alteromonas sp. BL110 TaxID=1714845 RepID=UPI000E545C6F|nr:TraB/GumN family protein [Alteromonas sp. BL110]AXT38407.1 TraB/GumN family protein [Alteromonas sp. BL110]RKM83849.1 TraB/GumN family protein [Alteromonas sp. BL110]
MKNLSLKIVTLALALACWSTNTLASDATTSVWKVSNGEDTVYIGGTIHILPISEFPLPDAFSTTYEKSDTIVLEAELPAPTDLAAQRKIMAAVAYEDGQSLKDELSEETYGALNTYLSAFGATADQVASFKPGMVVSMLVAMEAQRNQLAGEGVDAYFNQLAKRDGKTRDYLETLDFQIQMMANMGEGEEDRFISETLTTLPELKELLTQTIKAWRNGDTEEINEYVVEKFKRESPVSFNEVFTQRNANWVPHIEAMFGDEDQEFILVGAGHLVGEGNVLKLLENKGYKIEQL